MKLTLFNISQDRITKLLATDLDGLGEVYRKMIERNFYVNHTEISRKTLNDWDKENLLPFPKKDKGWTQFSLSEIVWLHCIRELRLFGMSIEKIRSVKDFFFDVDVQEWKEAILYGLENYTGKIHEKDKVVGMFKEEDVPDEEWLIGIQELQLNLFSFLIMEVIINDHNLCFVVDDSNSVHVIALGDANEGRSRKNEIMSARFMNTHFILINLEKIVNSFFANEAIKYDNDFIMSFLKPKEKKIIEKIRKGGIKEINVRFDKNNQPTHIEITESKNNEAEINKVARLLKKGEYSKVTLQMADGKLVNYEKKNIERDHLKKD